MKNTLKKIVLPAFLFLITFSPILALADNKSICSLGTNPKIQNLFDYVSCIINLSVIPMIFSLAFMLFIYGVVQYVLNDTDGEKRQKGKQFMVWGIIALTVMFTVWGLVDLLGGSFGLNTSFIPKVSPN